MLVVDEDLRSLIESGPAISVGTRNAAMAPHAVRGWGARVAEDGRTVDVFVDRPAAEDIVADVRDNARIAVFFVDVSTLRALQLKGRCVEVGDPQPDDWAWVDKHRAAFTEACETILFPGSIARHLWAMQVVRLRFVVEEFYDQTPGPGAGKAL
ncbi:MAG TPA: hypothetical protein VI876_12340 [Dehalococcoidia bacterium]|nr:hypothetical protein [Dehalococcoidia bacterium]